MIILKKNGMTKVVPTGFSWTTLFFGCFPALFRGDWKWAIIMIVAIILTHGIALVVFPFFYNKVYVNDLIERGWAVEQTSLSR